MFGSFGELDDFILGFIKYLHPLVDDALRESSDEEDHYEMKYQTGDDKNRKLFAVQEHLHDFVGHRNIKSELTESNECFPAGHRVQHYDRAHNEGKIECACLMDSVEEKASHHENGIKPETDV